jgi:ribonuclease J
MAYNAPPGIFRTLEDKLRIIPLGGVEEIGINITVLECRGDMIIVDCGLCFPEEGMHGVDFVIPDFSYVLENKDRLRGIIITHGHEDHTGSLPFLLGALGARPPVYGTALTLGLIREKLKEYEINDVPFMKIAPGDVVTLGCFNVEFIRVTHSISDCVALGIETPLGNVVHTGDFKFDHTPVDGCPFDFGRFAEYGKRGTLALLSDSTNSERTGFTPSESVVRPAFDDIFSKARGRVIVTTFASNIHRMQQVLDVAFKFQKKVVPCGRSVVNNIKIATELGHLSIPPDTLIKLEQLHSTPMNKTVIITTGSQGEPMSVLSRIAVGEHKQIKLGPNDTVIVSARAIPGNERAVGRIINSFFKMGANVYYDRISNVHVSGHASSEEQKLMINLVRPKYFIPIHGEYRQLYFHARIARSVRVPRENVFILQNGSVFTVDAKGASITGKVTAGRSFVDGKDVCECDTIMKDRRRLAEEGLILVLISVSKNTGKMVSEPDVIPRGFVYGSATPGVNGSATPEVNGDATPVEQDIIGKASSIAADVVRKLQGDGVKDVRVLQDHVHKALKKYIRNTVDRHPLIMPIVVEV